MNKKCLIILKGYELMQEIANGKIKEGTKFRDLTDSNYADNSNIYRYENKNFIGRYGGTNILKLLNHDFEIIEEEDKQLIDIQDIEDLDIQLDYTGTATRIVNELVKAVKQLDKKINKE